MSDILLIGDPTRSGRSQRGWLPFERFGLGVTTQFAQFNASAGAAPPADHAPAFGCCVDSSSTMGDSDSTTPSPVTSVAALREDRPDVAALP